MRSFRLLALFLLIGVSAQAKELYRIQRLSERGLTRMYSSVLLDACRHAEPFWQDLPGDPPVGCWGSGRSDQMNEGIRAVSGMVLACGTLLRYSDGLDQTERQHYLERVKRAIRYAVNSHRSGTGKCTDGKETPDGFETTGTLLINGGALKQTIRVTSIGQHTVVYQDRVTALTNVSIARELGVPIGIENDEVTSGKRTVYDRDGKTVFDWKRTQPPLALPGAWANVDRRLGMVMVAGSGLSYCQAKGYDPHTAVCADVLYGSFSDHPRSFKAGEEVAQRVVILFAEVSPKATAALSRAFGIVQEPSTCVLRFKLPEGGRAEVPLLNPSEHRPSGN